MCSNGVSEGGSAGLAMMLTVAEAARQLRIGRTLAYQLIGDFESGRPGGIPAVRLGGCLRVPRWALDEFVRHGCVISDINARVTAAIDTELVEMPTRRTSLNTSRTSSRPRLANPGRDTSRTTSQLSLLDGR
jgi:excisionase family DNA binding protein